jgi:hypothetical protein
VLKFVVAAVMAVLSAAAAFAQTACAPEKFAATVDAYANEPFGARAWRKLNGLGDDGTTGESYGFDTYAQEEEWRKLVQPLVAADSPAANRAYDCRIAYPLEVLKARIGKFGANSDYVKIWVKGQEEVFRACGKSASGPAQSMQAPIGLKPDEVSLLKWDTEYQKASVLFYSQPQNAVQAFKAIAATASPHKAAARYNIANIFANANNIAGAKTEARAILADASLASIHDITRDLIGYIANIEDTAQGWTELIDNTVATLEQPAASFKDKPAVLSKALYDIDYAGVTAKKDDWWVTNTLPPDATLSKALADSARKHPMVLWMMAGQSINKPSTLAPWALVGDKWNAWQASYVDRSMALLSKPMHALPRSMLMSLKDGTDDATRKSRWDAAQAAADKAFASCGEAQEAGAVTYFAMQAVRLSALAGRYDEIYANLPKLKLDGTTSLKETILPKLMQHFLAAGQVEEGRRLRDALLSAALLNSFKPDENWKREPYAQFLSWVAEDEEQFIEAVGLMTEKLSPEVLNLLPASKLRELADQSIFTPDQQALLKRAAWTRNFASGARNKTTTTEAMLAANPALAKTLADVTTQYPRLKPEHAQLLTMLRNPRYGVLVNSPDAYGEPIEIKRDNPSALDSYDANDKNWWCPLMPDRHLGALRRDYDDAAGLSNVKDYDAKRLEPVLVPDAVAKANAARDAVLKQHPMVKAVGWKEVAKLAKVPSGPKLMTQAALKWAKTAKGDEAAAEALALAVRATRYGCRWAGSHEAYSKPAQELLKKKYATSTWTQQTPYWFGCMDEVYGPDFAKVTSCKPREWPKQEALR